VTTSTARRLAPALALAASASLASPLASPLAAQGKGKVQRVDFGGAVAADGSVRLFGGFSSLRVIGWERDSVSLTGTVPAAARVDGGFGPGGKPARGAKLYVELPPGVTGGALELRVPARARVWVKAGVAEVTVTGVTGALDVNVVGGSIAVTGSPRELRAEAMDGAVTVDGAPEWLRVKTASGDVRLRGGAGQTADAGAATVSGAVHVVGGRYERVRLETVTGAVTFAGALARGAALDVETHGGAVELALGGASAEVDVVTLTGAIANRLTAARPVTGRDGRGRELGFTVGDGSARVVVRSFKGDVRVLAEPAVATPARPR
jgi:hypothetical protein